MSKIKISEHNIAFLEVFALGPIIFVSPDIDSRFTHFTWWGISFFVLLSASIFAESLLDIPLSCYIRITIFIIEFVILIAVIVMSHMQCSLLTDAYNDVGPVIYIAGNFAMHYYPCLRILVTLGSTPYINILLQTLNAGFIILIYAFIFHPQQVYGCPMPSELITPALWLPAILMGSFLYLTKKNPEARMR